MKTTNLLLRVFLYGFLVFKCMSLTGQSKMDLMKHWAPQVYQDTRNDMVTIIPWIWTHQFYEAQDFILKVNFDGNWYAGDQRENSTKQAAGCGPGFEGHAYASMVETNTHYFFGYGFYHSMDDAILEPDRHENDYEDVYICVRKDGSAYGQFQALVTNRHGDMLKYTASDLNFSGSHAQVYISSNGDVTGSCGIYGHGHGIEAYIQGNHCTGNDAIIYNVADKGQIPTICTGGAFAHSYNYSLIDIDELWNRRMEWDNHPFQSYGKFGGDGTEATGGNAPWGNDYFKNPAPKFLSEFSWLDDNVSYETGYIHNPYFENQSDGSGSPVIGLDTNWNRTDIGNPDKTGYSWIWKDTYTINGAGNDIWNYFDQFHFVYQPFQGNGTIVARLYSIQENIDDWSKAGVMIRESLDANSKHSMFVGTSGNGVSFQNRTSSGGSSISITRNDLDAAPGWLKLNRNGNIFTAYYSEDGSSWISLGNQVINMSESVYIGLAVSSHNTESLCSTTFTDVSITQATLKSALNDDLLSQPEDFDITIYGKENNLVISTSSETLINSKLMVFDVMGRLIIETKLESLFNEYPIANKGIYIVKIHSPEALLKHEKVLIR